MAETSAAASVPEAAGAPAVHPLEELGAYLEGRIGAAMTGRTVAFGELTIEVTREAIVDVLTFLRHDDRCRFSTLVDITAVDWPAREERFDVVYHLLSMYRNHRIRVKLRTGETDMVPSVTAVFPCANWFEREVFDMFGVVFSGHPDLRRILTDYGFRGHPLRKDFPTTGYSEVRYDETVKRVVYEPVKLTQEYRLFDFLSPWEGGAHRLPGDEKA
ncbi:NADH dehydrogenase subunit C [Rubellimicrobium thermophilum DSM 16684]|uniref:NADH-quinone oxidoreductase subunit C n=1 Tax=Rubellimicrobium thermophilum DSM 16684 TaxID=1123069 RepID=S9SJY4_9RHOB|nr:NADH-quinone oxidoreductase subunit C [Rubellimicrobium thermophilum]EPX86644.1 NADH dehydrogenase subunit C [Rubellimicrobium thermophilum DSM 16684]